MTSWHAFGIYTIAPKHEETYRKELWNWYTKIKNFSFIFKSGAPSWFHYGFHLWSIPVEVSELVLNLVQSYDLEQHFPQNMESFCAPANLPIRAMLTAMFHSFKVQ